MRHSHLRSLSALLLALCLLCTACGPKTAATTMRLMRTEGEVRVADGGGKSVAPAENLLLYSGYDMETQTASFAWISLDDTKLTKMDEESGIEIQKDGKKLEIIVNRGSLFFHVTEPLEKDETLNIRTSSMLVGIRGTCGWVEDDGEGSQVFLLEGRVEVGAAGSGSSTVVSAGEVGHVFVNAEGKTEITVSPFPVTAVPAFVQTELEGDEALAAEILDASGLDVLNPPDSNEVAHTAFEQVFSEFRDAHAQGLDLFTEFDIDWNNPPDLSGYRYIQDSLFIYGWPTHYAYCDMDGNGVDELVMIQIYDYMIPSLVYTSGIYGFNGAEAVLLEDQTGEPGEYAPLTDGTILKYVGNGGTVGAVYRLSADGYTLEAVPDSPYINGYEWPSDRMLVNTLEPTPLY